MSMLRNSPRSVSDAVASRRGAGALRLIRTRARRNTSAWRTTGVLAAVAFGTGFVLAPDRVEPTVRAGVVQPAGWPLEGVFTASLVVSAFLVFRAFDTLFRTSGARALQCLPVPGHLLTRDRIAVLADDAIRAIIVLAAFVVPAFIRPGGGLAVWALGYAALAPVVSTMVAFGMLAQAGAATSDPTSAVARAVDGYGEVTGGVWHLAPGAGFAASATCLLFLRLGFGEWAAGDGDLLRSAQVALLIPLTLAFVFASNGARVWARDAHRIAARFFDAEIATADDRWLETSRARFAAIERKPRDVLAVAAALQLQRRHPVLLASAWGAALLVMAGAWASGGVLSPTGAAVGLVAWYSFGVAPGRRTRQLAGFDTFGAAALIATQETIRDACQVAAVRTTARLIVPLCVPAMGWGLAVPYWLVCAIPGAVALVATAATHRARSSSAWPVIAAAVPAVVATRWPEPFVWTALASALVTVASLVQIARFRRSL